MKIIVKQLFTFLSAAILLCLTQTTVAQKVEQDTLIILLNRLTDPAANLPQKEVNGIITNTTHALGLQNISDRDAAILLLSRAIAYSKFENFENANKDFAAALKHAKKESNKVLESITLQHLGTSLQQQGKTDAANAKLLEALSIAKSAGNDTLMAEVLLQIGSNYWSIAKFSKAMSAFSQATDLGKSSGNQNIIIRGYSNEAICSRDLGHYDDALSAIKSAIEKSRKSSILWLPSLLNLKGSIFYKFGQQDSAIACYHNGLSVVSQGNNQADLKAVLLENLALCFKEKQQFSRAQKLLDSSLAIRKVNEDTLGLAKTYTQLGNLYLQNASYTNALESYLSALELRQQLRNKAEVASSLTSIGLLYRNLGLNEKAISYFTQALEERLQSGSPVEIGEAYTHLGNAFYDVKKYEKALSSYEKALAYRERANDNTLEARSLNSISTANQMLGKNGAAERNFLKALSLYQSNSDAKGLALVRNNLGNFYLAQDNLPKALNNFYLAAKTNHATGNKLAEGLCYRKIEEIYQIGRAHV